MGLKPQISLKDLKLQLFSGNLVFSKNVIFQLNCWIKIKYPYDPAINHFSISINILKNWLFPLPALADLKKNQNLNSK
jgi:hypothetical protein